MASYSNELDNQKARVGILGWFRDNISEGSSCILCGKPSDFSLHESEWLKKMADSIENESKRISQEPIRLEKDVENIRRHIEILDGQLTELKKERVLLESQSEDAEKARLSFQQLNQFIGRMQQAIASIEYSDASSEISLSLEEYKTQLSAVRAKIAKYQIKKNQDESLLLISHHTKGYANHLKLERSNSKMEFDLKELMLGFYSTDSPGEKEKPDYLYEIGSGENWMGYHIAFFLSLHEKFIDVQKSPVFSFLIIDQPTQVYFPSADTTSTYDIKKNVAGSGKGHDIDAGTPTLSSGKADTPEDENVDNAKDDNRVSDMVTSFDVDVTKARRIFEVLSQSLKSTKEQYQIIVTEHADEDVWGGIDLIHKVADWRGDGSDSYLIPPEWMNIAGESTSPQQPTEDNEDHPPGLEKETGMGMESSPQVSSADTLNQDDSSPDLS
ncbi:MAG TPA: hypothetical protein DEB39_08255 [Planctomycetaceae bacterium]|nr:hypothetical protein [Planctomycetaceae bacterium]